MSKLDAISKLVLQVRKSSVKLATNQIDTHKITDDNLSIKLGVINESDADCLRGSAELAGKKGRICQRQD